MKFSKLAFFTLMIFVLCSSMYAQVLTQDGRSPFVDVIRDVRESVVNIQVEGTRRISQGHRNPIEEEFFRFFGFGTPREQSRPFSAMGSGFIFRRIGNDVYILTNNHVVEGGRDGRISVTLADKDVFQAEIVGLDPDTDLAVIKITVSNNTDVVVAEFGDSEQLEIGEWAIAIGNPFGQLGLHRTVTVGVISAIGRSGLSFGRQSPVLQDYIQTDAAINPGNSGGPLVDINGKVIGVNAAITTTSGGNVGIGFAIPINLAKRISDDFLNHGRVVRAYMGILPQDISPEIRSSLGLNEISGVIVARVENDTPASNAGLQVGDVILEVNNQRIDNVGRFRIVVASCPVNQRIPVRINREGRERTLNVTLVDRGTDVAQTETPPEPASFNLGMRLDTLDSDIARRMNISADEGLLVTQVTPDSPATRAGIRPGDVIIEINRSRIRSIRDYERAIERAERDHLTVILAYVLTRDGTHQFVTFTLE
ncbi:MAG: Do family serine endopeptidase [Candidatus Cloacimonetes bacterium]|nr:Do family serine endopeptidase [Candidatus Cloacimonadota bacterium]